MILGFHHTAIATSNLQLMLCFYRDLLGFELVLEQAWSAGSARHDALTGLSGSSARFVVLRIGNAYLEIFEYLSPPPRRNDPDRPISDAGITHIGFVVDDIDAEYARLSAAGVRFHCPPGPPGPLRATYARDPEGNVFELMEFENSDHPFAYKR